MWGEFSMCRRRKIPTYTFFSQPITCMSLSLTLNLLVGTSSGLLHIYDSPTHQLLRTITTHKGLSIAHLATLLKPIDLTGHVNFTFSSSVSTVDTIPVRPIVPFQRMRDAPNRGLHEVSLLLPAQKDVRASIMLIHLFLIILLTGI